MLSDPALAVDWFRRTGLVHQAVLDDFADLFGYHVYACHRPGMIDIARKTFTHARRLPLEESSSPTVSPAPWTTSQGARHSSGYRRLDSGSWLDCPPDYGSGILISVAVPPGMGIGVGLSAG